MNDKFLVDFLASAIAAAMRTEKAGPGASDPLSAFGSAGGSLATRIAEELVAEAAATGLPLSQAQLDQSRLSGGNTAELVARFTLHVPFAFKLDQAQRKLAQEGRMMREVKRDETLPAMFRDAWPQIYAVRDQPPYAYLMEFFPKEQGWLSLEDRLFPAEGQAPVQEDAGRLGHAVLDVLFSGYDASRDTRARPNVKEDYVERIRSRLEAVAERDPRFRSQPLTINGVRFEPWSEYLDLIDRNMGFIEAITPPFQTVAHGDPNPGNVLLRTTSSNVEVKLIDPKEWQTGDYLFDIAKLTHFIEGTGPVEKPADGIPVKPDFDQADGSAALTYRFEQPGWTRPFIDICQRRVAQFAAAHGDTRWRARYDLGMASNLLGLPLGRLEHPRNPRPDAALVLYGEGLKWLDMFCSHIRADAWRSRPSIAVAKGDDIEPDALARARNLVREQVPDISEALDGRGFRLLHWPPPRANDQGKPMELSLEHEARLRPTSDRMLAELQAHLQASEGSTSFADGVGWPDLIVERYNREFGAQSVDHYFDLRAPAAESRKIIPNLVSLRQRIRGSKFMTWSTAVKDGGGEAESPHPLNLELPPVAIGDSGVIARLEFNWIDALALTVADALGGDGTPRAGNPLYLASLLAPIALAEVGPVIEHTTFREKYALRSASSGEGLYQLNIDHIVVQSLRTRRIGTYTDIDLAPARVVDAPVLGELIALTRALSRRYDLLPVGATKVWTAATVLAEAD